jgi:tetratricopeptide (TPR) repeat protein
MAATLENEIEAEERRAARLCPMTRSSKHATAKSLRVGSAVREMYAQRAASHLNEHHIDLALRDCDEAATRRSRSIRSSRTLFGCGERSTRLRQRDRAVAYIDRAIAIYDKLLKLNSVPLLRADLLAERANAYDIKGERDRAIADYDEAIRLNPKNARAFQIRGLAHRAKGDNDRAIADYDEAIRLDPKYALAFNNRGLAYRAKGDNDRAIADCDEAIRLDPRYAAAFNNRGSPTAPRAITTAPSRITKRRSASIPNMPWPSTTAASPTAQRAITTAPSRITTT